MTETIIIRRSDKEQARMLFDNSLQPFRNYAENVVKEYITVNADQPIGSGLKINEEHPLECYEVIRHNIFELIFSGFVIQKDEGRTDKEAFKGIQPMLNKAREVSACFCWAYVDESETAEVETFRQIEENSMNAFKQKLIDEGVNIETLGEKNDWKK